MIEIAELCVKVGFCKSKSEARRYIEQGSIRLDDKKVFDPFSCLLIDKEKQKYYVISGPLAQSVRASDS